MPQRVRHRIFLRNSFINFSCLLTLIVGSFLSAIPIHAVSQGDAIIVYGEGTVQTPRYRTLTGTTWSAESSLSTASAAVRFVITRAAPTRNEMLAGVTNASGALTIFRWNGSSWSNEWSVTTALGKQPRYDIAYEQSSGKAIVLYSTNAAPTNEMAYRIWDGSSWTGATNLDASKTSGVVHYIRLAARSGTDEVAAAWGDANLDLSGNYFDGTNGVWKGEPSTVIDNNLAVVNTDTDISTRIFDLAFEQTSGELLLVWGNNNDAFPHYITRTAGTSGSWSSPTSGGTSFKIQGIDITLAAEPGTDYIAYANTSNFNNSSTGDFAEAAMWTGSGWANFNNYDNAISSTASQIGRTSVEWVQSGGQSRAVVVYDDLSSTGVDWLFFNKNTTTWSAIQTDYTGTPAPNSSGASGQMSLYRNPYNLSEALYVTVDGQSDLYLKKISFNGSTLTWSSLDPSGASAETSIPSKVAWAAGFAYNAYIPVLSVDVVDASGNTVSSPSISMDSIQASGTCQTSTGTLGSSSQKIRVTNPTATPGWTLSIAATGGATSNWSSGSSTYDFNDATSSGCSDGADADSLAGQLSLDPSAGTAAAQSGCTTTGISKGSSSAFSQGSTDSITLMSASASAGTNCYWELTGVSLSQKVPELQAQGSYSMSMTVTVVAN